MTTNAIDFLRDSLAKELALEHPDPDFVSRMSVALAIDALASCTTEVIEDGRPRRMVFRVDHGD